MRRGHLLTCAGIVGCTKDGKEIECANTVVIPAEDYDRLMAGRAFLCRRCIESGERLLDLQPEHAAPMCWRA